MAREPAAGSLGEGAGGLNPIEAVAEAIQQAEAHAAPLVDLPFALTPEPAKGSAPRAARLSFESEDE